MQASIGAIHLCDLLTWQQSGNRKREIVREVEGSGFLRYASPSTAIYITVSTPR